MQIYNIEIKNRGLLCFYNKRHYKKENTTYPTQLDFLRILHLRGSDYFEKEKQLYKSLQAGADGEHLVLYYLNKHGRDHWKVLQNLWVDNSGPCESDLILITSHSMYVLEVKNFGVKFTYDNGICLYNNYERPANPIQQARRAHVNIKEISQKVSSKINVQGAALFVGVDNEVELKSSIDYLRVIDRIKLLGFIKQIKIEEDQYLDYPIDSQKIIEQLENYEIVKPYSPTPLKQEDMNHIRGGIYCSHCQNFNIEIRNSWIKCTCGVHESLEEAILRTICDYGVLHFNRDFTRKELLNFFDGQVSKRQILNVVYKHLKVIKNGRYTYYENKRLPYYKIKNEFQIKQPRMFYMDQQDETSDLWGPRPDSIFFGTR